MKVGKETLVKPTDLDFSFAPAREANWTSEGALLTRDLGLRAASHGTIGSVHLKADGKSGTRELVAAHDAEFYFV